MGWTADEVMSATQARPASAEFCDPALSFASVCTDSRAVSEGSLFIALRGLHHDAHRFVAAALRQGAVGALVERPPPDAPSDRLLVVADTTRALGDLAAWVCARQPWRVVAITGSNGKTTTKEILASICELAEFPSRRGVLKTHGNENNTIGLPLTILRARGDEAVAVLEMGMNQLGEIARLTEIARPHVGVITNVGAAHLEGLGDLDGVAVAKGELYAGMDPAATIVVNAEDERVVRAARGFAGRRIDFGSGCEVAARLLASPALGEVRFALSIAGEAAPVRLAFAGAHNVSNALAAAACGHALGIPLATIVAGIEAARPPAMRMQVEKLANGVIVINDSYNANPSSMEAGLRALAAEEGRRWAVLGEMRELGPTAPELHRDLGRIAAQLGIEFLVAVGDGGIEIAMGALQAESRGAVQVCKSAGAAADLIRAQWRSGDVIFVKGSRGPDDDPAVRRFGSRMAEVVACLQEAGARG